MTLPWGHILQYVPLGKCWMFCVLGKKLVQEGKIERVNSQYSILKNDKIPNMIQGSLKFLCRTNLSLIIVVVITTAIKSNDEEGW